MQETPESSPGKDTVRRRLAMDQEAAPRHWAPELREACVGRSHPARGGAAAAQTHQDRHGIRFPLRLYGSKPLVRALQ